MIDSFRDHRVNNEIPDESPRNFEELRNLGEMIELFEITKNSCRTFDGVMNFSTYVTMIRLLYDEVETGF